MNILFLDQYSDLGGAQQVLLDTLDATTERGWHAHVLIPAPGPLWDEVRSRGVSVSTISCGQYRARRKSAGDAMRFPFDVSRQVTTINLLTRRGEFDLIYVNGPRLLPAVALARGRDARVVFHAHSHVKQKFAAWLVGRSVQRAGARVVACSHSVAEPLRTYTNELCVIPNGVRDMGFHHRDFGRDGKWRIGLIGRIAPEKGQTEFLRAAARLQADLPGAEFLICGAPLFGASDRYSNEAHTIARGLPVRFLEWQADVSRVLHTLDLLVVPSIQEGMGRVALEAFSAGVPVIAFPTGGIPEIVKNGETGFLTPEVSPEALAELILEVTSKRELLQQVVFNVRRVWQCSYTTASYKERITRLLESLASANSSEGEKEALPQPQ
ncbi:MAG TPA: glycosyltransferase family 4 protein [Bryobacteraceae bacterium]|nr:glycosyltransferase family 4 protein [Bryobacteraceae bacterium]